MNFRLSNCCSFLVNNMADRFGKWCWLGDFDKENTGRVYIYLSSLVYCIWKLELLYWQIMWQLSTINWCDIVSLVVVLYIALFPCIFVVHDIVSLVIYVLSYIRIAITFKTFYYLRNTRWHMLNNFLQNKNQFERMLISKVIFNKLSYWTEHSELNLGNWKLITCFLLAKLCIPLSYASRYTPVSVNNRSLLPLTKKENNNYRSEKTRQPF